MPREAVNAETPRIHSTVPRPGPAWTTCTPIFAVWLRPFRGPPPRRRPLDQKPSAVQGHDRAGQRAAKPSRVPKIRHRPIDGAHQRLAEGLELAEFDRPFVSGPIDRALQEPQLQFLWQ